MGFVKTEGAPKQFDEKSGGDEPGRSAERKHQPHRYLLRKERNSRADQPAFDEPEMVINEKMDVGDVRRQQDLMNEHPGNHRGVDGKHQTPRVLPDEPIHSWATE